jgi:hypothetical protein
MKGVSSSTQNSKNIHGRQSWDASAFSRRRTTGERVDSGSASEPWLASESMARLMVLAMKASDCGVEDTQRRAFFHQGGA